MKKIILPAVLFTLACAAQAATVTVNDSSDTVNPGSVCTLRGAVDAINNGSDANGCSNSSTNGYGTNDTIEFAAGLTTINVQTAGGGSILIEKDLTINGLQNVGGQPGITLDGGGSNRIFIVANAVSTLTITNVKFINGYDNGSDFFGGGAILFRDWDAVSDALLTLENCVFEGNKTDYNGGGAVMAWEGSVTIRNSAFNDNEATESASFSGRGGAVYAGIDATIHNSTFSNNTAAFIGGAVYAGTDATIHNSTFSNNTASTAAGNAGGGAIWVSDGGAIISNSRFIENIGGYGGAVHAVRYSSGATAIISNSTFNGNTGRVGGAVYAEGSSYTVISNSTFSDNIVTSNGGAVYAEGSSDTNISNSTFSNNAADSNGGAVYISRSTLTARHLTLLNNSAIANGQALYLNSNNTNHTINLYNSIIIGNNGNNQCVNSGIGSIAGSHNLEGWAAGATDSLQDTNTCNTANPVSGGGAILNAIITTTLADNDSARIPITQTLALPEDSPAIEAADPGESQMLEIDFNQTPPVATWVGATEDQRGYGRAANSDERSIGAYERGGTPPPTPPSGSGTPIPALPAPLLLALAALVGTAAAARQRQRRRC